MTKKGAVFENSRLYGLHMSEQNIKSSIGAEILEYAAQTFMYIASLNKFFLCMDVSILYFWWVLIYLLIYE